MAIQDQIPSYTKDSHTQRSNGLVVMISVLQDFVRNTEGLQFDPGLDHSHCFWFFIQKQISGGDVI